MIAYDYIQIYSGDTFSSLNAPKCAGIIRFTFKGTPFEPGVQSDSSFIKRSSTPRKQSNSLDLFIRFWLVPLSRIKSNLKLKVESEVGRQFIT